jgi:hypothetical protein
VPRDLVRHGLELRAPLGVGANYFFGFH